MCCLAFLSHCWSRLVFQIFYLGFFRIFGLDLLFGCFCLGFWYWWISGHFRRYLFDIFSWETGPFEKAGRTPEIATSKTKADSKCGLPPHPLCPPSSLHNYCFCRWPQASERSLFSLKKECTGYNDCLSFTYRFSTSFGLLVAIWLEHFVSFCLQIITSKVVWCHPKHDFWKRHFSYNAFFPGLVLFQSGK